MTKETLESVAAIFVIFIALPILILWLNDKFFNHSLSKKELDEYSKRFKERLSKPDIVGVEKHFDCVLPDVVRRLYGDKEKLDHGDFEIANPRKGEDEPESWHVAFFTPLDQQQIKDAWPDCKGYLTFADDGCGNSYVINPRLPDAQVQFYDHEDGQFYPTGLTLDQFLSAPRSVESE